MHENIQQLNKAAVYGIPFIWLLYIFMHFILNFNIIAILGKRRLVRADNPFHPFFLPN